MTNDEIGALERDVRAVDLGDPANQQPNALWLRVVAALGELRGANQNVDALKAQIRQLERRMANQMRMFNETVEAMRAADYKNDRT